MGKTRKRGGSTEKFIFMADNISTQPNTDSSYKEVGILHVTDSTAVNIIRGIATNVSNLFGDKGFDNPLIDDLRNSTLEKVKQMIKEDQKVCNLRMEIEAHPKLIFHHVYGTLLSKKIDNKNSSV